MDTPSIADFPDDLDRLAEWQRRRALAAIGRAPKIDALPDPAPPANESVMLSGFDGMSPNGPWQLWVMDDLSGEAGQFAGGWSVTIKATVRR